MSQSNLHESIVCSNGHKMSIMNDNGEFQDYLCDKCGLKFNTQDWRKHCRCIECDEDVCFRCITKLENVKKPEPEGYHLQITRI